MDTIPFHLMMFALEVVLIAGLLAWPSQRSALWGGAAVVLFGGIGIMGIGVFARLFRTNLGQCLAEGLTYHGTFFLSVAAVVLYRKKRRRIAIASALLGLLIFAIGFDALVWEPNSLVIEHYTIESPKIVDPLRIVFAADIQTDRIGRHERRTMQKIMEQEADLILLGGDYLQYYKDAVRTENLVERFNALLHEIPLTAPLGVYAIRGNLDGHEFNDLFKDTGVIPVVESELFINWGGDKKKGPIDMALLSMSDSIDGVQDRAYMKSGNFSIMAGHLPHYAYRHYRDVDYAPDLMLAGHTHGGQVVIPFYGPIVTNTRGRYGHHHPEFMSGMHVFQNGSHFLVTRGTGMERAWAPRVRFFCKPEISVIDLVPAK